MAIGVALGLMSAFFMAGMYVAAALGCLSLIMMLFFSDAPLWNIMPSQAWGVNTNFILVAVPLFVLMGELMNRSGIGERMYAVISRWIWFLPGGLLHTNVVSCAVFSACSGSSVATSATISRASLPSFRRRGYSERMVMGSLAAGGTLGILIPPSISLIIYGVIVDESIGRLYMAGFVPGILLALCFMVMIGGLTVIWRGMAPREHGESFATWQGWRARLIGTVNIVPVLALVALVLGVIYAGIATPTEAAAFGVTGAFVLAILLNSGELIAPLIGAVLRRTGLARMISADARVSWESARMPSGEVARAVARRNLLIVQDSLLSTVRTTGMIFLILLAALTLSFAFARLGISQQVAEVILNLNLTDWQLVLALVIFYLLLGTFMESFAMMVTTIPILLPALQQAGVDLVWFGIIIVLLVEAALISPPEGINLYVMHGVRQDLDREEAERASEVARQSTIKDVWIGVLPFMACMAIVAAIVLAFPQIALWLPDLVYGSR